ncbi:MAG TPA: hypothetical protein VJ827_08360 [Rubrobacter sp.]|nr:hypothetical protein [Rubrobacter sp.]
MSVPGELRALVERFDRDRDSYRSGKYNEARVDFINPLLGLLGWDVENRQGRPEAYRDVVYEDRVKVGGGTKAPDYGFYAGGRRRFFLEAKKPSVDIAGDLAPAVQLRRYAWSSSPTTATQTKLCGAGCPRSSLARPCSTDRWSATPRRTGSGAVPRR